MALKYTSFKLVSLDTANAVLSDELKKKTDALDALIAPRHGESNTLYPSLEVIRKVSIGTLKTQIKSIRKAIRINTYMLENIAREENF